MTNDFKELERPIRESGQNMLFDIGTDWEQHWWGMPAFEMKDARPQFKLTVNFMTAEDVKAFSEAVGAPITTRSDSMFYPPQEPLKGQFEYDGPPADSRYPVCIPSKGRADCQKTGKALDRMGVSHKFFVEETEADDYTNHLGSDKVVSMPFHDLGQGSVPARNFIWEWCKDREHRRHWTVDDNICCFTRCHNNRRLIVRGGRYFAAMEDFVDRYENVPLAGPHDQGFVKDREPAITAYGLNSRVYSCCLLDTTLPYRWRGRYNEDTDLTLRLLKDGYCTILFRAFLMSKDATYYGDGVKRGMKGGNTDNAYNTDDYRRAFAESLRDQHPDVVKVVWKFNRWHHQVDYSRFKQKLKLREGVTPIATNNEYGMELVRCKLADGGV